MLRRVLKKLHKLLNAFRERLSSFQTDKAFLTKAYTEAFGRAPRWSAPQTLNEKILWRNLYDRRLIYTELADKYRVRTYVAALIGPEYLIPLLGVYPNAKSIDFDALPDRFVLKCSHDCGSVVFCRDRTRFDAREASRTLDAALRCRAGIIGARTPSIRC